MTETKPFFDRYYPLKTETQTEEHYREEKERRRKKLKNSFEVALMEARHKIDSLIEQIEYTQARVYQEFVYVQKLIDTKNNLAKAEKLIDDLRAEYKNTFGEEIA